LKSDLRGIKAIFFDAGGTLLHLDSSRIQSLLRDQLSIDISIDRFPRAQSLAMSRVAELVAAGAGSTEQLKREFYTMLLPETGVSTEKLSEAVDCAYKLAREEMLWRKTEDGTARVLEELKYRGYILAVVSNSDGRIETAFAQAGLTGYFDFFIDSFNVGIEKPDPGIFLMATERARIAPHHAAYVGDLYAVDVIGARAAGLVPILYNPFDTNRDQDCLSIRSLNDLLLLGS
jgi:HAD superfamily hydrolase (TIGR01509 family)